MLEKKKIVTGRARVTDNSGCNKTVIVLMAIRVREKELRSYLNLRRITRPRDGPWSFFLRAEDGIRDRTVTGVQTCALPIYVGGCVLGDEVEIGANSCVDRGSIDDT